MLKNQAWLIRTLQTTQLKTVLIPNPMCLNCPQIHFHCNKKKSYYYYIQVIYSIVCLHAPDISFTLRHYDAEHSLEKCVHDPHTRICKLECNPWGFFDCFTGEPLKGSMWNSIILPERDASRIFFRKNS